MDIVINTVLNLLYEHRYIFSFLGAVFEGTYIMILAGVLFKFGYFKFWGVMSVLLLGYLINGFGLYYIGRIGGYKVLEKLIKGKRLTSKLLEKLENYFKKHSIKTLFLARLTYGLGMPVFIMAGSFKMKLKKFALVNLAGAIVWIIGTFWLGYMFGVSYKALGIVTKTIGLGLIILIFVIAIAFSFWIVFWLRKFARTKFVKSLENNRFHFLRKLGAFIINSFKHGKDNKKNEN